MRLSVCFTDFVVSCLNKSFMFPLELNPNSVLPSGSFQGSLALEDFDCVLCGR